MGGISPFFRLGTRHSSTKNIQIQLCR